MNKEVKKLWVEALRSGKFKQTTGRLNWYGEDNSTMNCHCVLGVLCEVYNGQHSDSELKFSEHGTHFGDKEEGRVAFFSKEVYDWAGLPVNEPIFIDDMPIWSLNDDGMSFTQLADIIEAQL